ncbi:MAG: AraC family transcriptional regulator [Paracoccaceae bacterium]|nr:MAG: AraC family transcriptional regulator [Paracoccaceae bacterium]
MNTHQIRIDRVYRHIALNLDGDLSLDRLADVAALSRFHFHRMFSAMTGETVAEAVRRARLNRAAVLVVGGRAPLARIAAEVGYPNIHSFARAVRAAFGVTPAALRRRGVVPPALIPTRKGDLPMHPVRIETVPPLRLAALPHRGPYPSIGATFAALWDRMVAAGLVARIAGPGVAIYYDDPSATPAAELRAHAAVAIGGAEALPEGFDDVTLPGGRCAILTLRGPYTGFPAAWAWLYGQWLPDSGEVPADRAPWEAYLNSPSDTAPADLLSEIRVPLA